MDVGLHLVKNKILRKMLVLIKNSTYVLILECIPSVMNLKTAILITIMYKKTLFCNRGCAITHQPVTDHVNIGRGGGRGRRGREEGEGGGGREGEGERGKEGEGKEGEGERGGLIFWSQQ